jgi:hypothetical protein
MIGEFGDELIRHLLKLHHLAYQIAEALELLIVVHRRAECKSSSRCTQAERRAIRREPFAVGVPLECNSRHGHMLRSDTASCVSCRPISDGPPCRGRRRNSDIASDQIRRADAESSRRSA